MLVGPKTGSTEAECHVTVRCMCERVSVDGQTFKEWKSFKEWREIVGFC